MGNRFPKVERAYTFKISFLGLVKLKSLVA